MSSEDGAYNGSCFCGAVQFTVSGEPAAMGYCHCESCRHWSAGPVNAFSLWDPDAVQVTRGADNIGTYNKTPKSYRKWCKTCGGHIFTEHNVKAALVGTYRHVSPKHAQAYRTSLAYRFNRRHQLDSIVERLAWAAAHTAPQPYRVVTADA